MTEYPFVIRNRAPLFYRAFMLLFLGGVILMLCYAMNKGLPEPREWWPIVMVVFVGGGLWGFFNAMNEECALIRVSAPNNIKIERGGAFRRVERWTDQARFWIKERKDSDGIPYFELIMDFPRDEPLCIAQSPRRSRMELLQRRVEAAVSGLPG